MSRSEALPNTRAEAPSLPAPTPLRRRQARARPVDEPRDFEIPVPTDFRTESGEQLPDTHMRLRRFGHRNAPPVLVMGGISSGRELAGARGWWPDLVGRGAAIDLNEVAAFGFDFAPLNDARVTLTPRTQARLIELALDCLAIDKLDAVIGASYGGMVALALAASAPSRVKRICVISAAHRPSPLALAWRGVQRRTVEFALEQGKGEEGLALARQLAMITYRSAAEFGERFHCLLGADGRSDLDRYLLARGRVYGEVMGPLRWLSLSESIDRCHVSPEAIQAPTTLMACRSDQITPFDDMAELAKRLPRLTALHALNSIYGHDAFLKEPAALSTILRAFLENDDNA